MSVIETIEQLEEIYGRFDDIGEASTAKVADCVTAQYRRLIEVSPFAALATTGPEGWIAHHAATYRASSGSMTSAP